MSDYGYLNHTSTDKRDEEAITIMFAALPSASVTVEQMWSPGETYRPAFEALMQKIGPGDTLYVHSIDRLGVDVAEVVQVWKTLTQKKQADIVVLDNPSFDSRQADKPSLAQVRKAAQRAFEGVSQDDGGGTIAFRAFRLVEARTICDSDAM